MRLPAIPFQAVERWRQDQHHQRYLEEQIGQRQAEEGEQVETCRIKIETEPLPEQDRDKAGPSESRQKGESKRYAREVRRHAGKGQYRRTQPGWQVAENDRPGQKEADNRAAYGRCEADLDRYPVGAYDLRLEQVVDVLEREVSGRVLKCTDDEIHRRPDQKQNGEDEKRCHAKP